MMKVEMHEVAISRLATKILEDLAADQSDPLVKAAALKTAAEAINQAAVAQATLAAVYQALQKR